MPPMSSYSHLTLGREQTPSCVPCQQDKPADLHLQPHNTSSCGWALLVVHGGQFLPTRREKYSPVTAPAWLTGSFTLENLCAGAEVVIVRCEEKPRAHVIDSTRAPLPSAREPLHSRLRWSHWLLESRMSVDYLLVCNGSSRFLKRAVHAIYLPALRYVNSQTWVVGTLGFLGQPQL